MQARCFMLANPERLGGPLIDSKTRTVVGIVSISRADEDGFICTGAALFTRVGSYLDFINKNLGQRGFTDGDNQRVKVEAKRPALLEACKTKHFDRFEACMTIAEDIYNYNENTQATEEEWAAYDQYVAKCDVFQDLESACDACAEEATVDSTDETVIQCSEAVKKGD
ncbi:hypothetical protein BM221_005131 [Beauveria bassiana]|uniref:Peptidase S1 domain-containing protein n=1 Tax=Beauveria bassiana TaxID=176275 RepID=A0A2N6NMP7_BEABA|nr:hypothetical protein BM221_005131 [Beauveria bassiana]